MRGMRNGKKRKEGGGGVKVVTAASHDLLRGKLRYR